MAQCILRAGAWNNLHRKFFILPARYSSSNAAILQSMHPSAYRLVGRSRHGWKDNIKKDLQEVGCVDMDWIELAQHWDRWRSLMNAIKDLRLPYNAGNLTS